MKNPSLLTGVHWIAKEALKRTNFEWEIRRRGEVKLGYWKKVLRTRDPKSAYPKRLILLPGFGDTPLSWLGMVSLLQPFLRQHYDEILMFDFPGFGGFLAKEKCFPSLDRMMEAVDDTLDSLKPHTIMGHSLGGWLTAHYAALCGQELRPLANRLNYAGPEKIVLVNPSGVFIDDKTRDECQLIFRNSATEGFKSVRPHLFAKEPRWFSWMTTQMDDFFKREDIIQFVNSFTEQHLIHEITQHIQSDVWLVWGEKDTLLPATCADAWLKNLNPKKNEHHHVVVMNGVGHSPHLEKPLVMAAVLAQILVGKSATEIGNRMQHPITKRWWKVLKNSVTSV